MPTPAPETRRCPLCGQDNQCAMVCGQPTETCWCMTAPVSPTALAAIPDALRGFTCLCPACAASPLKETAPPHGSAPI
ncbi:MAG TPA: cysteine-rich CWC family protein [Acidovorax sp.]|nr:cysteine-rich CWC family protein [Acidovorax sp.]